jgi:TonB family protein
MSRGDHTFAVSLGLSLAVHAALAAMVMRQNSSASAVAIAVPTTAPTPRPASIYIDDRPDAFEEFGAADGIGKAANAAPGDLPMIARNGDQTQAFLSRDPVGPGAVGDDPSMSVLPKTTVAAAITPPPAPGGAAPRMLVQLIPPGNDETALVRMKASAAPTVPSRADTGGTPGTAENPADPAIMSDSESDPFAPGMQVDFRDGRVDARLGRKVKTVRPKLDLAARIDLMSTNAPSMTVRLTVDAEGAVRRVEIVRSSGSVGTDQAVKVALYQWWVEPKKDDAGRAIASVLTFPIAWR